MKLFFTMCAAWLFFDCSAQHSLSGNITDLKNKEPLIGATIYVHDLKSGTTSDTTGYYEIKHLPKGKFLVEVSYPQYQSQLFYVTINEATTQSFSLEQTATELNEVVVTGNANATNMKRNPLAIITTDRKEMNRNSQTNIMEAVAKLPGVSMVSTGPNIAKPVIRGLSYNRVLTLFNGFRQEGQQWGDEHGIEVDEYAIDRIEVIKGPASLIYGSDALAGVVNLISPKPIPNGQLKGSIATNFQSNNGLIGVSADIAGSKNGLVWGVRITHKQAQNYRNTFDGRVYGTSFNENDGTCYLGITKKWGYSQLHFTLYDNVQSIPDGTRDSVSRKFTKQINEADTIRSIVSEQELNSYQIPTLHQHIQHYRLYWTNQLFFTRNRLVLNVGLQQSRRQEFSHPEAASTPGLALHLNTLTYDMKYILHEVGRLEPTIGINGLYQTNTNFGTEFIIPDYRQFDMGPFIHMTRSFNKIDLSAGLRYDFRIFNNSDFYTTIDPISGFEIRTSNFPGANQAFAASQHQYKGTSFSLGATYNFNASLTFKANLGRGYRAPNISELSSHGVHPGTNIYQIGNPNFLPEFSLQEDLGLLFSTKHISGSVEVFHNQISHYIYNTKMLTSSGTDSMDQNKNTYFTYRQNDAQLFGGEASLDIHPHPFDWLHFENSISVVYAQNSGATNDSNRYLPLIPPVHTHSELRVNLQTLGKWVKHAYAKMEMDYFAAQNRVLLSFNTETVTPSYALTNLGFGGDITTKQDLTICSLYLVCSNLFDIAYQSNMSRLKYMDSNPINATGRSGIYNMGRNFSIKIVFPISIAQK